MFDDQEVAAPLAGTLVLDLSRYQPGAYCTRMLTDLGANVVKLDPPGGDATRYWINDDAAPASIGLHRGKRSLTLDLKHERGPDVLRRLAARADVVVESGRPGALAEQGLGYEHLSADNPGLVWCSITGFGQDGPYRDLAGHDITYLGYSGALAGLIGDLDERPFQPPLLLAGSLCGLMAATGIAAALAGRARTGKGRAIDANIGDAAMWLMIEELPRAGRGVPPWDISSPARRVYVCGDGRRVSVAAAERRPWTALCEGLGLADLAEQPPGGPPDAQDATTRRVAEVFATQPAAYWVERLGRAAVGPVNTAADLPDDPHVRARGSVHDIEIGGRNDHVVSGGLRFSAGDVWQSESARANHSDPGADTDEVLRESGFEADEIDELRRAGAVGG